MQNLFAAEKTNVSSTHALTNGIFALTSLKPKEGDTLVLAQLGDPCLPKDAFTRLPGEVEVICLDFSEFENGDYSPNKEDGCRWENDPNWSCNYLGADDAVAFRGCSEKLLELAKSKPVGAVKCFFDLSNYPIGALERIAPTVKAPSLSRKERRGSSQLSEQANSKWNWAALDTLIAELVKNSDPLQWNRTTKWGPFLYTVYANLICGNGLSATILPEAYLKSPEYLQARNSLLGDRAIHNVVYLPQTNNEQDYPAMLLTSNQRNEERVRCAYAPSNTKTLSKVANKLNLDSADEVITTIAKCLLNDAWKEEDCPKIGLNHSWRFKVDEQLLSRNEVRLDSAIASYYRSYRGYEATLSDEVDKIQSYSAMAIKRRSNRRASSDCIDKIYRSDNKGTYSYLLFPWSVGSKTEEVLLDKKLPEENCLKPGDILVARVTRRPDKRAATNTSSPKVTLIHEDNLRTTIYKKDLPDKGRWLCPASCICIRPKANDPIYSLALYKYLESGHGEEVLSAIVRIRSSFTWDALSTVELPPALVFESEEWYALKAEIEEAALAYYKAYREWYKTRLHLAEKATQMGKELSDALK